MAVVLITGSSSGFGWAMVQEFARRGDEVYASVRALSSASPPWPRVDGGGSIHPLELDVTSGASIDDAIGGVLAAAGRIDILVNNAGMHRLGAFEDMPESELRLMFETNFFGAVRVTRAVLPAMREQRSGHILMMSSIGALISRPTDAYYCASKSALEAAAEALRYEVARFGIHVTSIEPGAFRTQIAEKGAQALYDVSESPYAQLVQFRIAKLRDACRHGDDPLALARAVAEVAHEPQGIFRRPLGNQAKGMVEHLRAVDDIGRDAYIREKSQTNWWIDGQSMPV
ncbi:MAG TPA: SDR family oxidoreductase [Steroidobacter sp.]